MQYAKLSFYSRLFGVAVANMGLKVLIPIVLSLIGTITSSPYEEFRSNLEYDVYSTNLDEPAYRLKDTVQPTHIILDLDVFLGHSNFTGNVQIRIETTEENITQIVLHQKVVAISTVNVLNSENEAVGLQHPDPFETDDYYELLKINLGHPIPIGTYTIIISYLGQINENPLDRGFYKGYYYVGDNKHEYATTQFQPYHARKAFPCFDEPQFKSQYIISITRDNNLNGTYSNMATNETEVFDNGRTRQTFLPTPIISAYLIAFHVSDFVETTATGTAEKPFGIISRQGVTNQHPYAAFIGMRITEELDDYLGINYYEMGQGQPMKNDHIALPDFPSGAMENWGMVNYREAYLLYDEDHTNLLNKIFIATIAAHELAHKWFGNLVTCFWWSNLWLNESYASFFEYFSAHAADPDLELADQFIVDYVHSALNWDAGAGATPMNWAEVASNPSVTSHFSTTSYAKGASVLRMMEHFVGPRNFRNALRLYLRENAYGIGTPEDMYNAFRATVAVDPFFTHDVDVGAVFESWVENRGSPVLNVTIDMVSGDMTITQERFQLSGDIPDTIWQLPITWTHEGAFDFSNTTPSLILTQRSAVITKDPGHDAVIFNVAQSGLYRVNYDDHNWQHIASLLRSNRLSVHRMNRAQIVNDVLYFIRSGGRITISRAFDVLSFLKDETDYYVWAGALGQLDWIRRRLEHLPAAHEEFTEYLLELMETVIQHLGFEERPGDSTSTILNRMQIINYACHNLHHEGCVNHSRARWQQYRQNTNSLVPPNERRYVYCMGLREGDAADYTFLFQQYNTSENTADMVVILRTLACTRDEASLQHYLQQSMYNDKIRIHDRPNAFSFALQGNEENLQTVLDFVYERHSDIIEWYGGAERLGSGLNALSTYFSNYTVINEFQVWLYDNQETLGSAFQSGVNAIDSAVNNRVWANSVAVDIMTFLVQRNSAAAITTPVFLLLAALFVHLIK